VLLLVGVVLLLNVQECGYVDINSGATQTRLEVAGIAVRASSVYEIEDIQQNVPYMPPIWKLTTSSGLWNGPRRQFYHSWVSGYYFKSWLIAEELEIPQDTRSAYYEQIRLAIDGPYPVIEVDKKNNKSCVRATYHDGQIAIVWCQ
jgi:hypothetical protein